MGQSRCYTHKDLIAGIRDICCKGGGDREVGAQVDDCLRQALRNDTLLESWDGYETSTPFKVLHLDPDYGFYITASTMEPGYFRMPHDHGPVAWNIYGTYRNEFVQRVYRRVDDGTKEGHAELEIAAEYAFGQGETYTFFVNDIHRDMNLSSIPATNIIIRQKDPRGIWRNVYHPDRKLVKPIKAGNLLLQSKAEYDAFFDDASQPVPSSFARAG